MVKKKRVEWIDCAKGIAILLVILGHSIGSKWYIMNNAIYSFHMVLFMVLSAITMKCAKNKVEFIGHVKKVFKGLVVPAIFMYLIYAQETILNVDFKKMGDVKLILADMLLSLIYSNCYPVELWSMNLTGIGIAWFLIALAGGKITFDYLQLKTRKNYLVFASIILSIIGVMIGRIMYLPFLFDIVLALMPIFYFGYTIAWLRLEDKASFKMIVFGLTWLLSFGVTLISCNNVWLVNGRNYSLYPLCYVTAMSGSLVVIEFCVLLMKIPKLSFITFPLIYLGRNTLTMLFIHLIDTIWLTNVWQVFNNGLLNVLCRFALDFVLLLLVVRVREGIKSKIKGK